MYEENRRKNCLISYHPYTSAIFEITQKSVRTNGFEIHCMTSGFSQTKVGRPGYLLCEDMAEKNRGIAAF